MLTLCNTGLDMRAENKLYKELYLPQRACNIVKEMRRQHREACNQLPIMSHGSLPFSKLLKKVGHYGLKASGKPKGSCIFTTG